MGVVTPTTETTVTKTLARLVVLAFAALALAGQAQAASPMRYCGSTANGLAVLANTATTCPFAKSVAKAAFARPTVRIYSFATHKYVSMKCRTVATQDSPYRLCTGGNGAVVKVMS